MKQNKANGKSDQILHNPTAIDRRIPFIVTDFQRKRDFHSRAVNQLKLIGYCRPPNNRIKENNQWPKRRRGQQCES